MDPNKTYHLEIVLLRPEEFELLDDKIHELEKELQKVKSERERYYLAMSEYVGLKIVLLELKNF